MTMTDYVLSASQDGISTSMQPVKSSQKTVQQLILKGRVQHAFPDSKSKMDNVSVKNVILVFARSSAKIECHVLHVL